MTDTQQSWTTASLEAIPRADATVDPTPGCVLVYSRLHRDLPPALPFSTRQTTIGRDADNTLAVHEGAVSRYHARVTRTPEGVFLEDVGSTNGTMVNGVRIRRTRLRHQDVVRIGDSVFRYTETSIYAFAAYPLLGPPNEASRPVQHRITEPLLIGGLQIDALLERIEKVAPTALAVVITGESGTGKELVAKELHRASRRRGPFQAINCAALPANLLESELFGYRKGAFTGATRDKDGLMRAAHDGTLFLDEIGDMPLAAQAKLLRVLQEKEVLPLGATRPVPVNVRVVCATHRDLDALVAEGNFRGDLLARLREVAVHLPPLRDRREDIFRLVRHFLAAHGAGDAEIGFSYMLGLAHYHWPYNVRELESAVKLSVTLAGGKPLDLRHLRPEIQAALDGHGRLPDDDDDRSTQPGEEPATRRQSMPSGGGSEAPTEQALRALLAQENGNIAAVGRALGKQRMQVHRWLKRYGIDPNEYR